MLDYLLFILIFLMFDLITLKKQYFVNMLVLLLSLSKFPIQNVDLLLQTVDLVFTLLVIMNTLMSPVRYLALLFKGIAKFGFLLLGCCKLVLTRLHF